MTDLATPEPPTHDFDRTRRSLLTRLKNWDDHAGWRDFMDAYGRFIFAMARRSGLSPEEAEDVLQETVLSVAKKIPNFRYEGERGSFKAWLVMIIRSRVIDLLRKKGRRLPSFDGAGEDDGTRVEERVPQRADELSHEGVWQSEWEKHMLETAMNRVKDQVSPRHFLTFRLCADQGQSPAEVAKALGISLPMVYIIRHRVGKLVAAEVRRLSHD